MARLVSHTTLLRGGSCSMQVCVEDRLELAGCAGRDLALSGVAGGAVGVESPTQPVVSVGDPCGGRDGAGGDGGVDSGTESGDVDGGGDGVGGVGTSAVVVAGELVRVVGGDGDVPGDASTAGALGGLVRAGVGTIDEAHGEVGAVEWAVEQDECEVGGGVDAVLVGGGRPETAGESGGERVEHDSDRVGVRSADGEDAAQHGVGGGGVGVVAADGGDDVIEGADVAELVVPGGGANGLGVVGGGDLSVEVHGVLRASVGMRGASETALPRSLPGSLPRSLPNPRAASPADGWLPGSLPRSLPAGPAPRGSQGVER